MFSYYGFKRAAAPTEERPEADNQVPVPPDQLGFALQVAVVRLLNRFLKQQRRVPLQRRT
jgi:hypothetical protein